MPSLIGAAPSKGTESSSHANKKSRTEKSHASDLDIGCGSGTVKGGAFHGGPGSCRAADDREVVPPKEILNHAKAINVLISKITTIMKKLLLAIALLVVLGFSTQAQAGVVVGVGIGIPGPGYYPGYYPYPPPPYYYGYGPSIYFGPGYYPWYHGYWHGGYWGGYRGGYAGNWHGGGWNGGTWHGGSGSWHGGGGWHH